MLGIEKQTLNDEIMNFEEMERFIDNHYKSKLFRLDRKSKYPHIKDAVKNIKKALEKELLAMAARAQGLILLAQPPFFMQNNSDL